MVFCFSLDLLRLKIFAPWNLCDYLILAFARTLCFFPPERSFAPNPGSQNNPVQTCLQLLPRLSHMKTLLVMKQYMIIVYTTLFATFKIFRYYFIFVYSMNVYTGANVCFYMLNF